MIEQIISGGQTGVDRAALDFALKNNILCGGWCPKGRLAEDGIIPPRYPLKETNSKEYRERTEWNIKQSHGTLIIYEDLSDKGTSLTYEVCKTLGNPVWKSRRPNYFDEEAFRLWMVKNDIIILNVAGPRESSSPGIYARALDFLTLELVKFCF